MNGRDDVNSPYYSTTLAFPSVYAYAQEVRGEPDDDDGFGRQVLSKHRSDKSLVDMGKTAPLNRTYMCRDPRPAIASDRPPSSPNNFGYVQCVSL